MDKKAKAEAKRVRRNRRKQGLDESPFAERSEGEPEQPEETEDTETE